MVHAQPMRNGSLRLALLQGAAEAGPVGLALVELDLIAGNVGAERPWSGSFLVMPACLVLGLEAPARSTEGADEGAAPPPKVG